MWSSKQEKQSLSDASELSECTAIRNVKVNSQTSRHMLHPYGENSVERNEKSKMMFEIIVPHFDSAHCLMVAESVSQRALIYEAGTHSSVF